ncbi:MAG TPA: hypothetical protein VL286_07045 [Rhizomicrobium sp.]|nr:hypothetical protein [Rhizomicrobium sp.]
MSMKPEQNRGPWLAPPEFLFLGAVMLCWALFVIWLGKDTSWDFRNYHWYIPYAFLNGRSGLDVSVAHQATYYNPFLDIPFYLLATHTRSWIALGVLGAVQGANIVPLYIIARSVLNIPQKQLVSGAVALLCVTGGLNVGLTGATYYDNVLSLLLLSGLALVVVNRQALRDGPLGRVWLVCGAAGLLVGSAVGLKLPEAPFAIGLAAAALAIPGSLGHRLTRIGAVALGGFLGAALFAGYWFLKLYRETGNPLFPYFNQYFQSPLALHASYRDTRFIPHRLSKRLLFPILFSLDWRVADDLPFQDIRVGAAYVLGIATLPVALFRRRMADPIVDPVGAAALFAFAATSYVVWLLLFGIYRYIVCLEMLAPILIVAAVGLWPIGRRTGFAILAVLALAIIASTRFGILDKAPLGDPYIQANIPPIHDPDHSMILMTGETPMGYLVPALPHQIPVLRIDGWMIQPEDGSLLTAQTRARVKAFKGDLYVITNEYEVGRAGDALADYGLGMRWTDCQLFTTNLGGPYRFCPLKQIPLKAKS